jgi:hypothetical protein
VDPVRRLPSTDESVEPVSTPTADILACLKRAPRPEYAAIGTRRRDAKEVSLSKDALFIVFPTIPQSTPVKSPIDWDQDPFQSRSWQAQLHTLRFLDVLLFQYMHQQDVHQLRKACDIALDWISSNRRDNREIHEMAWSDKVVGDRAPFIGYLVRAAVFEDLVTEDEALALIGSALDHVEFLMDDSQYVQGSNHGLYQDVGLVLLSSYFDFLPISETWRKKGIRRFCESLSRHVAEDGEGIYLEHSPFYQWLIVGLIRRFQALAHIEDEGLQSRLEELECASGWLILPNGQTPPLGDSDMSPAPGWGQKIALRAQGMRIFRHAGIASVREGNSMLIASAGYHTHAHKHADELGFCLHERGELILAEAGKYGYDDSDPARQYAISSLAHNVLLVDNEPFTASGTQPYGGAMERMGSYDGWYAIEGCNPLLRPWSVRHHRLFLYRPDSVLVILDRLEATDWHRYTRLFHFGPGVAAEGGSDARVNFEIGAVSGVLSDGSESIVEADIRLGQREPEMAGWCFPKYRDWRVVPTVSLETEGQNMILITTISIEDGWRNVRARTMDTGVIVVENSDDMTMRVDRTGADRLDISVD